jgi:hypothetical protein
MLSAGNTAQPPSVGPWLVCVGRGVAVGGGAGVLVGEAVGVRVGEAVGVRVGEAVGVRVGEAVGVKVGVGVDDGFGVGDGVGVAPLSCTVVLARVLPAVTPRLCCPPDSWGNVNDTEKLPLRRVRLAGDCAGVPSQVNASAARPAKPLPVATTVWPGAPLVGETLSVGTAAEAGVAKTSIANSTARPAAHIAQRAPAA